VKRDGKRGEEKKIKKLGAVKMSVELVRATFKSKNIRQLDNLLDLIIKKYGQQNVVALTPLYMVRAQIYIIDLEVRIPKALF
jgi:hypothetical protein